MAIVTGDSDREAWLADEAPTDALKRELHEELSLDITVGQLLALDGIGPHGPWDDQLTFFFDCGALAPEQKKRRFPCPTRKPRNIDSSR